MRIQVRGISVHISWIRPGRRILSIEASERAENNLINASEITAVAVYPPIGIARVGNAPGEDDFILASELIGGLPTAPGGLRDESGKIMRQAVRFRLYARTKAGEVVEVTSGDGVRIEWRVTVANLKAGWYKFINALDLPGSLSVPATPRNADIRPGRSRLDIGPRPDRSPGPVNQARNIDLKDCSSTSASILVNCAPTIAAV